MTLAIRQQVDALFETVAAGIESPRVIEFFISGVPKAQPRHRSFAMKVGPGKWSARAYDPGTAEGWKSQIAIAAREYLPPTPGEGAVRVDADFIFPRPKYMQAKKYPAGEIRHVAKPDRDNCEKALLDALTQLGMFKDDCQVCEGEPRKFYAAKGNASGARVRITFLVDAPVLFQGAKL